MRRSLRRFLDAPLDFRARHPLAEQRKANVLADVHVRIERKELEHESDVALRGALECDILAAKKDAAGGRQLEPGDHAQRRGLAAARGPEQAEERLSGMVKVESFTATKSPNVFCRFSTRISAIAYSGNFETTMNMTVPTSVVTNE